MLKKILLILFILCLALPVSAKKTGSGRNNNSDDPVGKTTIPDKNL